MKLLRKFELSDRRALVTGSSSGIGASIALALAEAGADVIVSYLGNEDAAQKIVEAIKSHGRRSVAIEANLNADDEPHKLLDAAQKEIGALDILVSNVAVQHMEPWHSVSRAHFEEQVNINWRSALEMITRVAPAMIDRKWGRILTIGSVQEAVPHPEMLIYSALKAAQALMVRNLAKQFAPHGVTINNLSPGVINTDRSRVRLSEPSFLEKVLCKIPANYIGEADDCAGAALLLCSDAGRYISGQTLFVDGGMSL